MKNETMSNATIDQLTEKRSSKIAELSVYQKQVSIFEKIPANAIGDLQGEFDTCKGEVDRLQTEIETIEQSIESEREKMIAENQSLYLEQIVTGLLNKSGLPVSNFDYFVERYYSIEKSLKKNKVKVDLLEPEILNSDCLKSVDTIQAWFGKLDINLVKSKIEYLLPHSEVTAARYKKYDPRVAMSQAFNEDNQSFIDDIKSIDDCKNVIKYLLSKAPKAKGTIGKTGKVNGNSMKGQLLNWLTELDDGLHAFNDFVEYYETIKTGSSTSQAQYSQLTGILKKQGVAEFSKQGENFTKTSL